MQKFHGKLQAMHLLQINNDRKTMQSFMLIIFFFCFRQVPLPLMLIVPPRSAKGILHILY